MTRDEAVKLMRDRQDEIKQSLVSFPASTMDYYRQLCGEYNGIEFALRTLLAEKEGDE